MRALLLNQSVMFNVWRVGFRINDVNQGGVDTEENIQGCLKSKEMNNLLQVIYVNLGAPQEGLEGGGGPAVRGWSTILLHSIQPCCKVESETGLALASQDFHFYEDVHPAGCLLCSSSSSLLLTRAACPANLGGGMMWEGGNNGAVSRARNYIAG